MTATPLIPGRSYRVSYRGHAITVLAAHPCSAIAIALDVFEALA